MFDFIQTIFLKASYLFAGLLISVGLVSVPTPVVEKLPMVTPTNENVETINEAEDSENYLKSLEAQLEKQRQINEELKAQQETKKQQGLEQVRQLELQRQIEEQKNLELEKQKEAERQRALETQRKLDRQRELERLATEKRLEQEEQNRVNQIYDQTDALLSEYYQKVNNIDAQILAINQKYYEDTENLRQEGISASGIAGRKIELAREANRKIDLLQLEKESLRIEYLNKISVLEQQL